MRANALIIGIYLLFILTGCAVQTNIRATNPYPDPIKINADAIVQIQKLGFTGSLEGRSKNLHTPFLGAFAELGDEIKCMPHTEYKDAVLDVTIHTKHSSTTMTKAKYIPYFGGVMYAYGGGALNFNWEGRVDFSIYDAENKVLVQDSFNIEGQHTMKPKGGIYGMAGSVITGGGVMATLYPDEDAISYLGDEFLKKTGHEIAKRLRMEPLASYFVERTKERDGMDPKTYAEFMGKKKRLQEDRGAFRNQMQENLLADVEDRDSSFSLGESNIMVFGIGVDHYVHYPALNYAASDCKKFVQFFKSRYNISDEWAIALTDNNATAIKVIRFLEKNAAKLLTEDDTFIFYFSGHSAADVNPESTDADGLKKYMLLSNTEPDALPLTALSLNDLADVLRKLPCRRVIIFIDSCFAGTAGRDTLDKIKGIRISERTYKNFANISGKGRVIIASSAENQVSQETEQLQGGVFTHWLIDGLNSSGDSDGNHKIDIFELFNYVKINVEKQTNGMQTPVFRGTLDKNIVF